MIQGRWLPIGSDLKETITIRQNVFGRGEDETDSISQSVIVYNDDGVPVGTGRIFWQDGAFWLSDIGVLQEYRGNGFGDLLVRLLMFKALSHSAREIRLYSPNQTFAFFEKYGFTAIENNQMIILGEAVRLSHCSGNCANCEGNDKG